MNHDLYLKRQKMSLEKLIEVKKIKSYVELQNYFKSIGIKFSKDNEEIKYLFESNKDENVEKRTVIKSRDQEGRIPIRRISNQRPMIALVLEDQDQNSEFVKVLLNNKGIPVITKWSPYSPLVEVKILNNV